jgi:hypothetical protein
MTHARGRVLLDEAQPCRVSEQRPEGADRPGRDAGAARGPAATALRLLPACGLAGGDVRLHCLDVAQCEVAHEARTEQRFDVGLDPASIHRDAGRRLH